MDQGRLSARHHHPIQTHLPHPQQLLLLPHHGRELNRPLAPARERASRPRQARLQRAGRAHRTPLPHAADADGLHPALGAAGQ